MLIEVSVLQRFVLLLGHPVYSLDGHAVFAVARDRTGQRRGAGDLDDRSLRRAGLAAVDRRVAATLAFVVFISDTDRRSGRFRSRGAPGCSSRVALLLPMGVALGVLDAHGSSSAPRIRAADGGRGRGGSTARCRCSGRRWPSSSPMNWGFQVTLTGRGDHHVSLGTAALGVGR